MDTNDIRLTSEEYDKIFRDQPTEEEKQELAKFHAPLYRRLAILHLPIILFIAMCFVRFRPIFIIVPVIFILFDIYVVYSLKVKPSKARERYISMVNRYGKINLITQIESPETRMFYITPGNVDSYTFVTPDYLIVTQICIIKLTDIRELTVRPKDYPQSTIDRTTKNPEIIADIQNMCDMPVKYMDGKTENFLISLPREEINDFLAVLKEREEARAGRPQ